MGIFFYPKLIEAWRGSVSGLVSVTLYSADILTKASSIECKGIFMLVHLASKHANHKIFFSISIRGCVSTGLKIMILSWFYLVLQDKITIIGKKIETVSIFWYMGKKSGFPIFAWDIWESLGYPGAEWDLGRNQHRKIVLIILNALALTRTLSDQYFRVMNFWIFFYFGMQMESRLEGS